MFESPLLDDDGDDNMILPRVEDLWFDREEPLKEDCITKQREMLIGSKRFCITSVFPAESCATPTEKLIACIDAELEKEAHSA